MTTIYFRTDGNSDIATGHLMRCLTIARACTQAARSKDENVQITFLVSDSQSRSLLEDRFEMSEEFSIHSLNNNYRHLEDEVPYLLSYMTDKSSTGRELSKAAAHAKPWLFVDSYFATPGYFRMLSGSCKIAYLDDLRNFDCPVNLLINYDTDLDCPHYAEASHKLLGAQYTPLRAQFQSPSYNVRPQAAHVLLSTGGTDPYGLAEHLLHTIYDTDYPDRKPDNTDTGSVSNWDTERLQSLHYHVVTSRANTRYNDLHAFAVKNSHIHIHENVSDMASLMASCDMAVSAGGTTLSELCAVGVPTISYLMAENQRTAVDNFAAKEIIPCAGDIRASLPQNKDNQIGTSPLSSDAVISHILQFMTNMSENMKLRQKSSHKMRAFLDGCGAERIADALLSL